MNKNNKNTITITITKIYQSSHNQKEDQAKNKLNLKFQPNSLLINK